MQNQNFTFLRLQVDILVAMYDDNIAEEWILQPVGRTE
jgi:hypothetical protein